MAQQLFLIAALKRIIHDSDLCNNRQGCIQICNMEFTLRLKGFDGESDLITLVLPLAPHAIPDRFADLVRGIEPRHTGFFFVNRFQGVLQALSFVRTQMSHFVSDILGVNRPYPGDKIRINLYLLQFSRYLIIDCAAKKVHNQRDWA
ncbi:MAG: hypothetical protein K8I60_09760 [Anaerolineae bacterium]|nr:hypothetical protein [Anaerolineae bacterium]